MSNHEQFNVIYDGPALAEHRMNVRDLAPALIAISDLFSHTNAELNGESADVRVEVKGSFKSGSFQIELLFTQALLVQLRDLFASSSATAVSNAWSILTVLGLIGGGGLIGFLRRLNGRRPHQIEQGADVSRVWITQTEVIEVDARVVRLWLSRSVRGSLQKVLSPLERDGITNFGVIHADAVELDIETTELALFTLNGDEGEVVSDATTRKILLLESVMFKDGNKWRVHDGQSAFSAAMDDEAFRAKVDAGERFRKGDVLVVDLRHIQTIVGESLKTEFRIVKVHEHRAPLQAALL